MMTSAISWGTMFPIREYTTLDEATMFRELSEVEMEAFKQWARDNFEKGKEASPIWHPVVRAEWARLEQEQEQEQVS